MDDPQTFGAGLAMGLAVGLVLERYVLEPIAQIRVAARARRRRRASR